MVYITINDLNDDKYILKYNHKTNEFENKKENTENVVVLVVPDHKNCIILNLNRIELCYFLKEIHFWKNMRLHINQIGQNIIINCNKSYKEYLSYKWNMIANATAWEKVETENALSWLSTLGGGFSALGENFTHCAETAAKISLQQLYIGIRIGDPFLQARCKLFYSISLIQQGKLKHAKQLIKQQYQFAQSQGDLDERLINMCKGIWLKLQHCYMLRNQLKNVIVMK